MNSKTKTQTEMEEVNDTEVIEDTLEYASVVLKQKSEKEKAFSKKLRLVVKADTPIEQVFMKGGRNGFMANVHALLGGERVKDGIYLEMSGVGEWIENDNERIVESVERLYEKVKEAHKNGVFTPETAPFEFTNKGGVKLQALSLKVGYEKR